MKNCIYNRLLVIALLVCLTGCRSVLKYPMEQPAAAISRIEIVYVSNGAEIDRGNYEDITLIAEIAEADWERFLSDFYSLPQYRYFSDPTLDIHDNAIMITYQDGEFELIGELAAVYDKDGYGDEFTSRYKWGRFFHADDFNEFLDAYIN